MKTIIYAGTELPPILRVIIKAYSLSDVNIIANNIHDYYISGLRILHETDNAVLLLSKLKEGIDSYIYQQILEKFGIKVDIPTPDAKIAISIFREGRLKNNHNFMNIYRELSKVLELKTNVIPFTDGEISATVKTGEGEISLLKYFLAKKEFNVKKVEFEGLDKAKSFDQVNNMIKGSESVLIIPNDPVSIIPILKNQYIEEAMKNCEGHIIVISPPIFPKSAPLLQTLDIEPTPLGIAKMFEEHIDTFVIDQIHADFKSQIELLKMEVIATELHETEAEYENVIPKTILDLIQLETKKPSVIAGLKKRVQKIIGAIGPPEKPKE
ncbi:MAG: 2-phospho-L-lactate transferase CofD family protein [Candidatus Lokiarchaeia archaeon]